jgi:hypothetical protein
MNRIGHTVVALGAACAASVAAAQPVDAWYWDANIETAGCSASALPYVTGATAREAHALQVADYNARCAAVECYSYAVVKVHRPTGIGEDAGASVGEYLGTNRYSHAACYARPAKVVSILPVMIHCGSGKLVGALGACEADAVPTPIAPPALWAAGLALLLVVVSRAARSAAATR